MAGRQGHLSVGQMYTDLTLQLLNRDPSLCSMLSHPCAALHQNQNDSEIWVFREGFGTPPGLPLPGVFTLQLLQLSFEVDLQQRFRQLGQSIQGFNAIAGMSSAAIRSHGEYLPSMRLRRNYVRGTKRELLGAQFMCETSEDPKRR